MRLRMTKTILWMNELLRCRPSQEMGPTPDFSERYEGLLSLGDFSRIKIPAEAGSKVQAWSTWNWQTSIRNWGSTRTPSPCVSDR